MNLPHAMNLRNAANLADEFCVDSVLIRCRFRADSAPNSGPNSAPVADSTPASCHLPTGCGKPHQCHGHEQLI